LKRSPAHSIKPASREIPWRCEVLPGDLCFGRSGGGRAGKRRPDESIFKTHASGLGRPTPLPRTRVA
jgi:hypothetical protein